MRSTQKFPRSWLPRLMIPRMTAIRTAIPTAAERKFWTARPTICEKYDIVVSPP